MFDVDQKTVARWTDDFAEFFSSDALGDGRTQRSYQEQDIIVFNTIYHERTKNNSDPEKVRAILVSGERRTQLPPEAVVVQGDRVMAVYAELNILRTNLENSQTEIVRLRTELDTERKDKEQKISDLSREIGQWQAKYEILKEQLDDKE